MRNIISVFEIALIIVLPLILFYQRNKISARVYIIHIILLYLIWYLTYALLHELSHMLAVWLLGLKINDYQLIPRFWKGDFGTGYISTSYENSVQEFITDIAPYFKDFILLIIGFIILKRVKISNSFIRGLIAILLILSPVYDIFNNYFAYFLGYQNDFKGMANLAGQTGSHLIGSLLTIFGIIVAVYIFLLEKFDKEQIYTKLLE
jgi:hypothetical protein